MTVRSFIDNAVTKLKNSSITSARLDVEVIVADILGVDRSWLQAHDNDEIPTEQEVELTKKIDMRAKNEPVAYILGHKEFHGRNFIVNKDVLVPRPESESFIEILKGLKNDKSIPWFLHKVLDMGTGSGCLAITAKLEFPDMLLTATDTSQDALKTAISNANELGATTIIFRNQSLLSGDKQSYDIVMANLPYVPDSMRDKSIKHEPEMALFSGDDGLNHYKKLFEQLESKHIRFVMTESLLSQHDTVSSLAAIAGYGLLKTDGLVQLFTKQT